MFRNIIVSGGVLFLIAGCQGTGDPGASPSGTMAQPASTYGTVNDVAALMAGALAVAEAIEHSEAERKRVASSSSSGSEPLILPSVLPPDTSKPAPAKASRKSGSVVSYNKSGVSHTYRKRGDNCVHTEASSQSEIAKTMRGLIVTEESSEKTSTRVCD
ncbi:hypothetical protein SAMN05444141_10135 [Pseudovibrio denitrificans]|uniref:Lipoprotein n=1 Tax=Pseudovibrio denitrificans TaxID=258256 RepID=A0A1I6XAP1_9HYPH|nr:hypothetical protein [Pseudovibrio denitrificans]SFT35062.1 hypothetical protein SAMN05444141_10135 [Pseudovibrio denitrificans]